MTLIDYLCQMLGSENIKVTGILSPSFGEGWQGQQVKVSPYCQPQTHSPHHPFAGGISLALTESPLKKSKYPTWGMTHETPNSVVKGSTMMLSSVRSVGYQARGRFWGRNKNLGVKQKGRWLWEGRECWQNTLGFSRPGLI